MLPQAPVQGAGIDGQADDEADPVAIGPVGRDVGHGIAHGDADEPVGHESDVSDDPDVLIAAQDALDRRAGGIDLHQAGLPGWEWPAGIYDLR